LLRNAAEDFCSIALDRDAIARAGGHFEIPPILNTD
jgi:hypothetical protein